MNYIINKIEKIVKICTLFFKIGKIKNINKITIGIIAKTQIMGINRKITANNTSITLCDTEVSPIT